MHRLLAAAVVATALAVPGPAQAAASRSYVVPTRHGSLYLEVETPSGSGRHPVVLTYSPYSVLGRNGDAGKWTSAGFARAWADVVGTGHSGGCYDYGGRREKETAYDLVEWIARQPWSTGRIGMIGGSYNGTTAIAAAVTRPPHLTTIVPVAAISRWYDYAYSGGVRYTLNNERPADEGLDTPLLFDFGFAIPPPADDATEPSWQERVRSSVVPCDEVQHTQRGYSTAPDYDAFWVERDYARDAGKVTIPVLVAVNWGDYNVKQETGLRFWRAATRSSFRRLYAGTRHSGHGAPEGNFAEVQLAWMERWLRGTRNGLERTLPPVTSETSSAAGPDEWYAGPEPRTTPVRLYAAAAAGEHDHVLTASRPSGAAGASFVPTGAVTETGALGAPRAEAGWLWFESPPLARDTRIFGAPALRLWSTSQRTWITVAASVVDVGPDRYRSAAGQWVATDPAGMYGVTRAWVDSRYRTSLASQSRWAAGANGLTVAAKPVDWTFLAGHRIGLLVAAEELDWVIAKPYDEPLTDPAVGVDLGGRTWLDLPVVGRARPLFS